MERKWLHFDTRFRSLVDELKKACIFLESSMKFTVALATMECLFMLMNRKSFS